jgi:hypothetical protein
MCHEDVCGIGNIALPFLTSALDGGDSATRPDRLAPMERVPGGPHSRSGRYGEEKNLALPEIEPGTFSSWPVAIPIELSLLLLIVLSEISLKCCHLQDTLIGYRPYLCVAVVRRFRDSLSHYYQMSMR